MSEEQSGELAEYVDAKGNTFQLNEVDAKTLGYAAVEAKIVVAEKKPAPAKRTTATTK